jgi:hypothetical protein
MSPGSIIPVSGILAPEPVMATSPICTDHSMSDAASPLTSNHNFSNFIGFMSNPLQNIDPRSLTQIAPLFLSSWVGTSPALPDLNGQVYGPAISVALSDRFCVGLNQGGYAVINTDRNDNRHPLLDLLAKTRGQEFGGTRDGFLNVGGYAQYTLIEDVENQFLATVGVRMVVPCGSHEVFQGYGPAIMAPYVTVGKELGNFHVLGTTGYQFPLRSGDQGTELFYLNAHLDHEFCGWIYPLVEVNWTNHSTSVPLTLPTRHGLIDMGNYEDSGNVATLAVGMNLVLIRDRLEFGAVYVHALATQHNIDIDGMLVKLLLRY